MMDVQSDKSVHMLRAMCYMIHVLHHYQHNAGGKGGVTGSIIIQLDVFVSGLMEYTNVVAVILIAVRLSNKEATQTDMNVVSGTSGCLSHGISLWMGVCVLCGRCVNVAKG